MLRRAFGGRNSLCSAYLADYLVHKLILTLALRVPDFELDPVPSTSDGSTPRGSEAFFPKTRHSLISSALSTLVIAKLCVLGFPFAWKWSRHKGDGALAWHFARVAIRFATSCLATFPC